MKHEESESLLSDSQKGKVIEHLIAAACVLQSSGLLRISVPLVDDEGVDLVVTHKITDRTILLQIKSRFTLSKRKAYRAQVRRVSLRPAPNRFLLFVYYDRMQVRLGETIWLVPTPEFYKLTGNQNKNRPHYVFCSFFTSKKDMWKPYQISTTELAKSLIQLLS